MSAGAIDSALGSDCTLSLPVLWRGLNIDYSKTDGAELVSYRDLALLTLGRPLPMHSHCIAAIHNSYSGLRVCQYAWNLPSAVLISSDTYQLHALRHGMQQPNHAMGRRCADGVAEGATVH